MSCHRGHSNGNERGSSYDRRARRQWLLKTFGDGRTAPCFGCGAALTHGSLTVDRIVPGAAGGRYVRGNIRPACSRCNTSAWQPWQRFLSDHDELGDLADDPAALAAAYEAWAA